MCGSLAAWQSCLVLNHGFEASRHRCVHRHSQRTRVGSHIVGAVDDADAGQPKVRELDVPLCADEQVVRLQVPMDDALREPSGRSCVMHPQALRTPTDADAAL